jgi:hypothetical protein
LDALALVAAVSRGGVGSGRAGGAPSRSANPRAASLAASLPVLALVRTAAGLGTAEMIDR